MLSSSSSAATPSAGPGIAVPRSAGATVAPVDAGRKSSNYLDDHRIVEVLVRYFLDRRARLDASSAKITNEIQSIAGNIWMWNKANPTAAKTSPEIMGLQLRRTSAVAQQDRLMEEGRELRNTFDRFQEAIHPDLYDLRHKFVDPREKRMRKGYCTHSLHH
jgi:hypothetical protein